MLGCDIANNARYSVQAETPPLGQTEMQKMVFVLNYYRSILHVYSMTHTLKPIGGRLLSNMEIKTWHF